MDADGHVGAGGFQKFDLDVRPDHEGFSGAAADYEHGASPSWCWSGGASGCMCEYSPSVRTAWTARKVAGFTTMGANKLAVGKESLYTVTMASQINCSVSPPTMARSSSPSASR